MVNVYCIIHRLYKSKLYFVNIMNDYQKKMLYANWYISQKPDTSLSDAWSKCRILEDGIDIHLYDIPLPTKEQLKNINNDDIENTLKLFNMNKLRGELWFKCFIYILKKYDIGYTDDKLVDILEEVKNL